MLRHVAPEKDVQPRSWPLCESKARGYLLSSKEIPWEEGFCLFLRDSMLGLGIFCAVCDPLWVGCLRLPPPHNQGPLEVNTGEAASPLLATEQGSLRQSRPQEDGAQDLDFTSRKKDGSL